MTIHDKEAYDRSLWDWGFLNECFKYGIRVSDMDGFVERAGWFLRLEPKLSWASLEIDMRALRGGRGSIKNGQLKASVCLARQGWTQLFIEGERNAPVRMAVWWPWEIAPGEFAPATLADVQKVAKEWFDWVNKRPIRCVVCKSLVYHDEGIVLLGNRGLHWGGCLYVHQYQCRCDGDAFSSVA